MFKWACRAGNFGMGIVRRGVPAPSDTVDDIAIDIDSTDSGLLFTWAPPLVAPITFLKIGGSANLSIHATTGAVSAAATTSGGTVQYIDVSATGADAVVITIRITFTNTDAAVVTYPFDALSASPVIATSWARRLYTSYTGPAGRVRRSSDNAQADIPYDVAGELDEAALLAHCGSGHGFLVTLYIQQGTGASPTQANPTEQPVVVNAGVIQRLNGKPAFKSIDSANSGLLSPPPMTNTSEMTVNLVARTDLNSVNKLFMMADFPSQVLGYVPYTDGVVYIDMGNGVAPNRISGASGITVGDPFIVTVTNSVTNSRKRVWIDASLKASDSTGQAASVSYFKIWNSFDGAVSEAMVFDSELSDTDRNLMQNNQSAYYGGII